MPKLFKRLSTAVALTLIVALSTSATSARGYRSGTRRLAPGVTYTWISDPAGPWKIKVVSVDLSRRSTIDVALAANKLPGFETTSSMAKRHRALVAINADYARSDGRPVNAFAEDGLLSQTSLIWGRNFAVNRSESAVFMGHPEESAWARPANEFYGRPIARVNVGPPSGEEIVAHNPDGGNIERPPSGACSARLLALESFHSSPLGEGLEANHSVDEVRCDGGRLGRKGGWVLSAPLSSVNSQTITALVPGQQVALGWSLGWPDVRDTVGGNPTLIEDGRIRNRNVDGTTTFHARHPRTGVGATADGRVLFVVVDGRRPSYSVGMTLREFAELFESLGATWALNLDGGGSTTMVVNGDIKNRPSDPGGERAVSSALLLLPQEDPQDAPDPLLPLGGHEAAWDRIARDPASSGGLSSWLASRGYKLPGDLARAASHMGR